MSLDKLAYSAGLKTAAAVSHRINPDELSRSPFSASYIKNATYGLIVDNASALITL